MATETAPDALSGLLSPGEGMGGLFSPTGAVDAENGSGRFFWGVDPGTVRVAVGVVDESGEFRTARLHTYTKHPPRSLERLATIQRETDRMFRTLAVAYPPAFVLVEEPGGKHVEPQLSYAVGCILSCVPIVGPGGLVPVASWKLAATGHGYQPGLPKGASKRDKHLAEKARLMRWAREQGYGGDSQDEADAVGIAFACRQQRLPKPQQLELAQ